MLGSFVLVGLSTFSLAEAAAICSTTPASGGVETVLDWGTCILNRMVVPLLVVLAMVGFIWGVIQYYLNPENEEKRKKGKNFIVGGLLALFVITAMWGLVGILTGTFNLDNSKVVVPQLPPVAN